VDGGKASPRDRSAVRSFGANGVFLGMASDRRRWSRLGRKQPFWASFAEPDYRADRITDEAIEAFFQSGERLIDSIFDAIRHDVSEDFHPARALDFGCGIGRLTLPLARESRHVLAVDISPSMLEEVEENCGEQGLANVEFMDAREFNVPSMRRRFDFVLSYGVFQHVKPRLGYRATRHILGMLTPGGVGALHYTYGRKAGPVRRLMHRARRIVPPLNVAANILQRRSLLEPAVPMYRYNLARLLDLFGGLNCAILGVELTEHRGYRGALFFLRKEAVTGIT
jgi:SAM-dependent methyltransferase